MTPSPDAGQIGLDEVNESQAGAASITPNPVKVIVREIFFVSGSGFPACGTPLWS